MFLINGKIGGKEKLEEKAEKIMMAVALASRQGQVMCHIWKLVELVFNFIVTFAQPLSQITLLLSVAG